MLIGDYTVQEVLDRSERAVASAASAPAADTTAATLSADYNHFFVYGQSLFQGFGSWPAKTTSGMADVLTIGTSPRPAGRHNHQKPIGVLDNNFHTAVACTQTVTEGIVLTPEQVAALRPGDPSLGEEPGVPALQTFRRMFLEHLNLASDPRKFVVSNVAVSGTTIEVLSKDAPHKYYNRLIEMARLGKAAAAALNGSYAVTALLMGQGEYNYNPIFRGSSDKATYKDHLLTLFKNFVEDVAVGVAGQAAAPVMFTYQTSGKPFVIDTADVTQLVSISQAQLELSQEQPGWHLAAPAYPVTDKNGHLDANGVRWLAAQFGKVMHEVLVKRRHWKPLSPLQATWRGSTVVIDFHVPCPPLKTQPFYIFSRPTTVPNFGLSLADALGVPAIVSASLEGDACVVLKCDRPLQAPVRVVAGRGTGSLGGTNLCDSDPTLTDLLYTYEPGSGDYPVARIPALMNKPYPLANWCVLFNILADAD